MIARSLVCRAGVFVLATAGLGFAAPALASGLAHAAAAGVGRTRGSASYHQGFAGYNLQLGGYGPALSVSETATFVVPKLRCGHADRALAPSVGAFVAKDNRLSAAALFVGCYGGKAHYWPELAVNGSIQNYPTKAALAGDTIVLRLNSTGAGYVSVADETHKFRVSHPGPPGDSVSLAWIGEEGWINSDGRLAGVPDFGALTYSNTTVAGRPLEHLPPDGHASPKSRFSTGTLQIKTGQLSSGGKAFQSAFKHS